MNPPTVSVTTAPTWLYSRDDAGRAPPVGPGARGGGGGGGGLGAGLGCRTRQTSGADTGFRKEGGGGSR